MSLAYDQEPLQRGVGGGREREGGEEERERGEREKDMERNAREDDQSIEPWHQLSH